MILHAEPQLFVADIASAIRFYGDVLGFEVAFVHGDPPFYAQVVRDGARLNLRHSDRPALSENFRQTEPDALSATFVLDDAAALFAELRRAGVTFHQPLHREAWGAQTFIVADPDGNLLCFAGGGALSEELEQVFAAPDSDYGSLDADTVLSRNS
jgi:catechol 2,3-dioxygenase-like lactoylglutathione lyase family enzyme